MEFVVEWLFTLFYLLLTGGNNSADGPQKATLVYFLGGCTYSEISALRFLAQQENGKKDSHLQFVKYVINIYTIRGIDISF